MSIPYRKPAPAEAPVHELIAERWSPRAFAETPVDGALVRTLLEAARWAPSSMNEQPWHLVVANRATDAEGHARILSTLVPFNAAWAGRAPVLMLVTARTTFSRDGSPNRWAAYDAGQAIGQLGLQATALGLSVHQMGGFSVEAAREQLGVPEGYEPMAVLAIGYAADAALLDEPLRSRETAPRVRRATAEWVSAGAWGKTWSDAQ